MELRVLGPLEVLRDGRPVAIRGRIQPRLLAVLTVGFGDVITYATLAAASWEHEPPPTARRQIHNAVSMLRGTLPGSLIETVGNGYRLNLEVAGIDARRFTKAVFAARRLAADGDTGTAVEELSGALRLWRGPVLHGIDFRQPPAVIQHLAEMRLVAIEQHAELSLHFDRPVDVPALRELARTHPDRQRLLAALMLALHRDGETHEALRMYERTRDRLAEGLGIEPGPLLRARHAAILREDRR